MSVLKTYGSDTISPKPSKTYRLNGNHIEGYVDGKQAVEQAVDLALSIERFYHIIYSGDYGVELAELMGKPRSYVKGDIERRITEALMEDDRIKGIKDFALRFEGDVAFVSFTVMSIFGDLERSVSFGGVSV